MDIKRSWPSPRPPPSLGTPSPLTHTLLCADCPAQPHHLSTAQLADGLHEVPPACVRHCATMSLVPKPLETYPAQIAQLRSRLGDDRPFSPAQQGQEATAQYNGTKNLSITIKREMEGSPEGEEGAAVCPESLDGMWATARRGLGSGVDLRCI
ncbi:unnamed protein product [Leuciscus chuanchicus]